MANNNNNLIVWLAVILVVIIVASGAVILFVPTGGGGTPSSSAEVIFDTPAPGDTAPTSSSRINTSVTDSSAYRNIDKQLISEGALPVPPPAVVGKANPFE